MQCMDCGSEKTKDKTEAPYSSKVLTRVFLKKALSKCQRTKDLLDTAASHHQNPHICLTNITCGILIRLLHIRKYIKHTECKGKRYNTWVTIIDKKHGDDKWTLMV